MVGSYAKRGLPGGNPLANVLVAIVGALVLVTSIVIGFVAFLALAGLVLVASLVVAARLWWFGRGVRKAAKSQPQDSAAIEGEFIVVTREERKESR